MWKREQACSVGLVAVSYGIWAEGRRLFLSSCTDRKRGLGDPIHTHTCTYAHTYTHTHTHTHTHTRILSFKQVLQHNLLTSLLF
jgi:hypothetical protein